MTHVVVMGPPASGKSTVSRLLAKKLGVALYDSGEVLREAAERDAALRAEMAVTNRIPDSLIYRLVGEFLSRGNHAAGAVWCGVPRYGNQPEVLSAMLAERSAAFSRVIVLECGFDVLLERVRKRMVEEHRADDNEARLHDRYGYYTTNTLPLVPRLGGLVRWVNAEASLACVMRDVEAAL